MSIILYTLWAILAIIIIIGCYVVINFANGQTTSTTKAPDAVEPTIVNTPTPTLPEPNLQYLPQKAYIQAYKPEVGLPVGQQPLTAVPQVVPVQPVQQTNLLGIPGLDVAAIVALIGTTIRNEVKGKTVTNIIKRIAGTQVKQVEVQEEALNLQFENMPQKGNEITNKPVIKQDNVKEIKQEALETAEKA